MEPTTQTALLGGLLVLLLVLLVIRSVGRRRARAADVAVEQPESEATPAEVKPVSYVEVEPEVEVGIEAAVEVDAELEDLQAEAPQPVAKKRRRLFARRSRRADEVVEPAPSEAVEAVEAVEAADTAELRALREHLRALEQVVQEMGSDHPTAALAKVEATADEQSEAYLRQVSLVVRALADHTSEDENPRRTLARVAAAVERLGVPNAMKRPILPVTNELSSRPQADASLPSHRLEVTEPTATDHQELAAPVPVPQIFAGIHATPAVDTAPAVTAAPAVEPAQAVAAYVAPAQSLPTQSYSDLAASAAWLEEPSPIRSEVEVPMPSEPVVDSGIPASPPQSAVLPVPPPATPAPIAGRRRGPSRKPR